MRRFVRAALALAAIVTPTLASAQAKPVIGVLYFDNNSFGKDAADYNGVGKGIAELMINAMAQNSAYRVVERERVQALLVEQNLVKEKTIDPQTAVRLGKIIGAQYMITGGFMSDGKGMLVLTSRVINVETSAITSPVKLQARSDDVLGLIAQLSTKLNSELKLALLPKQSGDGGSGAAKPSDAGAARVAEKSTKTTAPKATAPASRPKHLDVRTAMLYSKALDEQDSGHPKQAAELYRAVLQKFPDFGPAQQNLAKVQSSGD